jgi:hypothetical protein
MHVNNVTSFRQVYSDQGGVTQINKLCPGNSAPDNRQLLLFNYLILCNRYLIHLYKRVKLGCEADHSPPANAEVKKMWIYTSTPQYIFMA